MNKATPSISRQDLFDYNWLLTRLTTTSAHQLIQDFTPYLEENALQLIQEALQAAIHIISRDQSALCVQLFGRLQSYDIPEIQNLLLQAKAHMQHTPNQVWLQPLTQSLKSPRDPLLFALCNDNKRIEGITVFADGRYLLVYGEYLKVWDLTFKEEAFILEGDYRYWDGAVVTPDNQYLIANKGSSFQVWHLPTRQPVDSIIPSAYNVPVKRNLEYPTCISPNGQLLALNRGSNIVIYKLFSNDEPLVLAVEDMLECMLFTPDSQHVIAGGRVSYLHIWNLEDPYEFTQLKEHGAPIWDVAITPDGKKVIAASADNTLKVSDLEEKRELFTLPGPGHHRSATAITFTPNGRFALSGAPLEEIKIWDLVERKEIASFHGNDPWVTHFIMTHEGQRFISASNQGSNHIKFWDFNKLINKNDHIPQTPQSHGGLINQITLTPDGQQAISSSDDGTVKIWHASTGQLQHTLTGHTDAVYTAVATHDNKRIISASKDGTLKVWDIATGTEQLTLAGHQEAVNDVAIIPNTELAISASDDKSLKVWDLDSGAEISSWEAHPKPIWTVMVPPDGSQVISAADKIKVWNLEPREQQFTLDRSGKRDYHSGSNYLSNRLIAITSATKKLITDGWGCGLKIWNLANGTEIYEVTDPTAKGWNKHLTSFTTIPARETVLTGDTDGIIRIWDALNSETFRLISAHQTPIDILTIMPDGKRFITASCDHLLKVWDFASGELITTFHGDGPFTSCAVTANGTIIVGESSGRIHFLQLMESEKPIDDKN